MARAAHVQLTSLILGAADESVVRARRTATDVATMAGRRALLTEAWGEARGWVLQAFATRGYSGTWAATELSISVARPSDRTAVAEALADAVTADVVDDLVGPETAATLRANWALLARSAAIPEAGSLSNLTTSIASTGRRPGRRTSIVAGVILVIVGFFGFAIDTLAGAAFLIGGLVVLGEALLGRRGD